MTTLRVRNTFFVGNRKLATGELVDSTDPAVKGREHLFVTTESATRTVEQATAAPGEKRTVNRKK